MREQLAHATRSDDAVRRQVCAWLNTRPAAMTVATYAALPDEVDLLPLITEHPHHRWVLPIVCGEQIEFRHVADPRHQLTRGAFGIAEPTANCAVVAVEHIDAFLCPGLAFDNNGGRLGRGKGYYDRALTGARADALRIGVCQPFQVVATTFAEDHDIRMHRIIDGRGD